MGRNLCFYCIGTNVAILSGIRRLCLSVCEAGRMIIDARFIYPTLLVRAASRLNDLGGCKMQPLKVEVFRSAYAGYPQCDRAPHPVGGGRSAGSGGAYPDRL